MFANIPNYNWKEPVSTVSALPTVSNLDGDTRITLDTNTIYIWNNGQWNAISGGGGDTTGPISSTNESMPVFDGATGKLFKELSSKIGGGTNIADGVTKVFKVTNDNNSNPGFEIGKGYWTLNSTSRVAMYLRGANDPNTDYIEIAADDLDISGFQRRKTFYLGGFNWDYQQTLVASNGFRQSIATSSGVHRFDSYIRGASVAREGQTDFNYNNNGSSDTLLYSWGTEGTLYSRQTGKGLSIQKGTGTLAGNAVLVAGTVTVTNANITADSIILLTRKTAGGVIGDLTYTLSAGASFTINSANALDTSTVSYFIIQTHT